MVDYVTDTGLLVTDRRHDRASEHPQIPPRQHVPNGNLYPGDPTVGPESGWHAEAWAGWPDDWSTPYSGDNWSGYGYGRGPSNLTRVSTAMTCVDLNSRQLASFPAYGLKDAEPFKLPSWSVNPEPELYASWAEFMHGVVNALELRGEAFQLCTGRYADGFPSRFVNLNPDAVRVEWIDGGLEYLVNDEPADKGDICHIKYQSWPGSLRGIGPLEWSARSLLTASALETYATNLANRGGIPWGVLKAKMSLDGRQAADVQASWVNAAARRDGAPAVIGNGFELEPLSFNPEQMALLDLREFDERRICAAFGVPAYLVNVTMTGSLTYASANMLFDHHWRSTLRPLSQTIAAAWSNWLLPRGSHIEFNADRYVQPGFGERTTGYQTMFNIVDERTGERAMYVDEIRAAERLATGRPTTADADASPAQAQTLTGGPP